MIFFVLFNSSIEQLEILFIHLATVHCIQQTKIPKSILHLLSFVTLCFCVGPLNIYCWYNEFLLNKMGTYTHAHVHFALSQTVIYIVIRLFRLLLIIMCVSSLFIIYYSLLHKHNEDQFKWVQLKKMIQMSISQLVDFILLQKTIGILDALNFVPCWAKANGNNST